MRGWPRPSTSSAPNATPTAAGRSSIHTRARWSAPAPAISSSAWTSAKVGPATGTRCVPSACSIGTSVVATPDRELALDPRDEGGGADMTRAGPVDELIAQTPGWRGAMLRKLRKLVHDADPAIAEEGKWKRPGSPLGSAAWTHDGMVCVGITLKERVRLRVLRGLEAAGPEEALQRAALG